MRPTPVEVCQVLVDDGLARAVAVEARPFLGLHLEELDDTELVGR
jgi:hypothetical protein